MEVGEGLAVRCRRMLIGLRGRERLVPLAESERAVLLELGGVVSPLPPTSFWWTR